LCFAITLNQRAVLTAKTTIVYRSNTGWRKKYSCVQLQFLSPRRPISQHTVGVFAETKQLPVRAAHKKIWASSWLSGVFTVWSVEVS